jgi:hypothetical protein
MYRLRQVFILISMLLIYFRPGYANTSYLVVEAINIQGAKKTKPSVILNELNFKLNDTLDLALVGPIFEDNEKRLLSTGLFSKVDLNIPRWDNLSGKSEITITVSESWHFFITPVLELADRNFNVWAKEFNYDIQRLNYGLTTRHLSLSGRRDKLKGKFQTGYQNKGEIWYDLPGFKNGWGLSFSFFYAENKEVNAYLYQNKPAFVRLKNEPVLLRQWKSFADIYWRKDPHETYKCRLEYINARANNWIVNEINPDYFFTGSNRLNLLRLQFQYSRNHLIYPFYPENGYYTNVLISGEQSIAKSPFFNAFVLYELDMYKKVKTRFILGSRVKIKLNVTPQKIPYFLNQAIGYQSNILSGYALYAIDGSDFGYIKSMFKYNLANLDYTLADWIPPGLRKQNVQIFIKGVLDIGYVREKYFTKTNHLANTILAGTGPGIDFLFNHQYIASFDFQINHLGEKGIYWFAGFPF